MSTFSGLFIIAAVVALWVDNLRAREVAVRTCIKGCRERGVQLLDQTVFVSSIRPLWTRRGLRLRRVYRFDYSDEGVERHTGNLVLVGRFVVDFSLGIPDGGQVSGENAVTRASDDPDPGASS